jgi:hypothetical protein
MQAAMIDLLSGRGKFPTEQALVLAEAIDMAIEKTQFVTVPILDARFAAIDVRLEARFAAVDARFGAIDVRFAKIEARFDAIDARFAKIEARIDALEARMDAKMERWAVRMVIAMLISQTALGPIGMSALDAVRRVLLTLVH